MHTLALDTHLEDAISRLVGLLADVYPLDRRALAILLLEGDEEMMALVARREPAQKHEVATIVQETQQQYDDPLAYVIHRTRMQHAAVVVQGAIKTHPAQGVDWGELLSRAMMRPLSGSLILILVLLLLYWFVGVIGAQVAVDWLETVAFGRYFNPWITRTAELITRLSSIPSHKCPVTIG